jgi:hypothetical protein
MGHVQRPWVYFMKEHLNQAVAWSIPIGWSQSPCILPLAYSSCPVEHIISRNKHIIERKPSLRLKHLCNRELSERDFWQVPSSFGEFSKTQKVLWGERGREAGAKDK